MTLPTPWQDALTALIGAEQTNLIQAMTRPTMTRERLTQMPIHDTARHFGLTPEQVTDLRDLQIGRGDSFDTHEPMAVPFPVNEVMP